MSEPTLKRVLCPDDAGGHQMAYWEWGNAQSDHLVVCVHGLTRQGRDFDVLAQALCARSGHSLRVICPDVAGRGHSDWLKDPTLYQVPQYAADMQVLLDELHPAVVDWVGTSMGGLIGIVLCAQSQRVRRLVLNDVGPVLAWSALQRIGQYVGQPVLFDSEQQAADALWAIASSFGPHTPQQWLALTKPMLRPAPQHPGRYTLHYDPAIAVPFRAVTQESNAQGEALLWQLYDRISAQTLLVRGAQSDLLSPATAQAMTQRGPRARLVELAGVGHAPTFVDPGQVELLLQFLLAP